MTASPRIISTSPEVSREDVGLLEPGGADGAPATVVGVGIGGRLPATVVGVAVPIDGDPDAPGALGAAGVAEAPGAVDAPVVGEPGTADGEPAADGRADGVAEGGVVTEGAVQSDGRGPGGAG